MQRSYEIVILGATGYTATICAEYIAAHLPGNLSWAIAGRSAKKLESLAFRLKSEFPERRPPSIEIVHLVPEDLAPLTRKSRLIINGIGPYHLYSTPVVEACAHAGTHYIGFSLEIPWVENMIKMYHDIAKSNGAIIIPTVALSPSDIVAYLVVKARQESKDLIFRGEINSSAKLELQGMSGGSLSTVLSLFESYGIGWLLFGNPLSLSPESTVSRHERNVSIPNIIGYRNIPGLGKLTTSFLAISNESIVHRSASLMPDMYGSPFDFHEYLPVPNITAAILIHILTKLAILLLALQPLRWLARKLIPEPGTGPDLTTANVERQEFLAVARANDGSMIRSRFAYKGSLYYCSAFMGVEAAVVILGDEDTTATRLGGGVLTPVTLGLPFVDRLRFAGAEIDVQIIPNSAKAEGVDSGLESRKNL